MSRGVRLVADRDPEFQSVLDSLDEGVIVLDRNNVITAVNRRIYAILKVDLDAPILGRSVHETIRLHGDLQGVDAEVLAKEVHIRTKLISGGYHGGKGFRSRQTLRDGRTLVVRRTPHADGGAIVAIYDVSAEEALVRRTTQLETVIHNTDDGVFQIDGNGIIELFNQSMSDFYRLEEAGIEVGDHISKFVTHLLDTCAMDEDSERLFRRIDRDNTGLEMPLIPRQTITTHWDGVYEVTRTKLPGGGVMSTHRDVTTLYERQKLLEQAKAEAEDASRLKSEFIARVTHELRTPMHGVLGIAALLERSGLNDAQLRFLETLQRSGRHMVDLIDGLLTISTLETGDLLLDTQEADLQLLLEDSFGMLRSRAAEKQLGFVLDTQLGVHAAQADTMRLTQIIVNLLSNAIKFTDAGEVRLSASSVEISDVVVLVVDIQDTGPGIPDDKLDEIFLKFSQVGGGHGGRHEGVGLGLAIAQSLTELMNGRLTVRSKMGVGTVFSLEVPLLPTASVADAGDWVVSVASNGKDGRTSGPQNP